MKTKAKSHAEADLGFLEDLTLEEAARICGCTSRWLRQLSKDGLFQKKPNGRVRLQNVIIGLERSIRHTKPPGRCNDGELSW